MEGGQGPGASKLVFEGPAKELPIGVLVRDMVDLAARRLCSANTGISLKLLPTLSRGEPGFFHKAHLLQISVPVDCVGHCQFTMGGAGANQNLLGL